MEHRTQFDISPYKLSGEEGTRGKCAVIFTSLQFDFLSSSPEKGT